jgi:hypothetical protein
MQDLAEMSISASPLDAARKSQCSFRQPGTARVASIIMLLTATQPCDQDPITMLI